MTAPQSRQAIIALGANIGDRHENIRRALALLHESSGIHKIIPSPIFETAPVGIEDQPAFLNLVAALDTTLSPESLMQLLLATETRLGRKREIRWGPRTIDLDLLFFENETRDTPNLILPHPRWHERTFVTIPLQSLLQNPEISHPAWTALRARLQNLSTDPAVRLWKP